MELKDITLGIEKVIGKFAEGKGLEVGKEYDLLDVVKNSLDFMRFLVEVEEEFDIYIDQDYLLGDKITDKKSIIEIISKIMSEE